MDIHQSKVLPPPDDHIVEYIMDNIPEILRFPNIEPNNKNINIFGSFEDFPSDIKNKILSTYPKNILSLSSTRTTNYEQSFMDYCYNQAISKDEITKYISSNEITGMKYFKLNDQWWFTSGIDNEYDISNDQENKKSHLTEVQLDFHGYSDEFYVDTIFLYEKIFDNSIPKILLLDDETTKNILSNRISCIKLDKNYPEKYVKNKNLIYFNYFKRYPIMIFYYFKTTKKDLPVQYRKFMSKFITMAEETYPDNDIFSQTDQESYTILNEYYEQIFKNMS